MGVGAEVWLPSEDEIASLVGGEHDELLLELERIGRMVEAAKLGGIDHADDRAQFLADGHRSTAAWTRAVTNCSPAESRRTVRAARALRDVPGLRDALRTGDVGVDQVHEIARLHANPRCGGQVADSEAIFLQAARELEYADLCVVSQRWLTLADRARRRRRDRRCRTSDTSLPWPVAARDAGAQPALSLVGVHAARPHLRDRSSTRVRRWWRHRRRQRRGPVRPSQPLQEPTRLPRPPHAQRLVDHPPPRRHTTPTARRRMTTPAPMGNAFRPGRVVPRCARSQDLR
jgi:hypothetical protein